MLVRVTASELLTQAVEIFDSTGNGLARSAAAAWRTGFASGGKWMWQALEHLRGEPLHGPACNLTALGLTKYGLACVAALVPVCLAAALRLPPVAILAAPAFYAVEVQMVFLFPLAIEGSPRPLLECLRWRRLAGGTPRVMGVVMRLAATMLFGGFTRRGFVRSWCLGCLAVCIWYEKLRLAAADSNQARRIQQILPESQLVE